MEQGRESNEASSEKKGFQVDPGLQQNSHVHLKKDHQRSRL